MTEIIDEQDGSIWTLTAEDWTAFMDRTKHEPEAK